MGIRVSLSVRIAIASASLLACAGSFDAPNSGPSTESADLVFLGESIITVDPKTEGASAVAIRGETIVAVGDLEDVSGMIDEKTRVIELGHRALTPGFIDAHGHLSMAMAYVDLLNLSPPPVGPVESVEDIVSALRTRIEELDIPVGQVVAGYGYDDSLLEEGRHPDRDDLDRASTQHPIVLIHVSGHLATANSMALELFGYVERSTNPPGGVIRRYPGTQIPNGVFEEAAIGEPLMEIFDEKMSPEAFPRLLQAAIDYNTRYGITTIQEGATTSPAAAALKAFAAQQPLSVDVVAYIEGNSFEVEMPIDSIEYSPTYENGVRVGGVKFILDGSPQGRTAWLTKPYSEGPPGAPDDYVAYPIVAPEKYLTDANRLINAGIPIIVHANGDAAIDLMIQGVAEAIGSNRPDHRSVTIHSQVTRKDQLDRMADLRIVPSFFASHCFFWGDWHRKSFGDDRAFGISPLRSARDRGIHFTIHNDAPVVPPDIMRLIEVAMDRRTRSGFVLGADERISFAEALHAVTLGAAYAYFEENRKGSISVGKQADLVILGSDPRKVAVRDVSQVKILETIARGKTVYSAD